MTSRIRNLFITVCFLFLAVSSWNCQNNKKPNEKELKKPVVIAEKELPRLPANTLDTLHIKGKAAVFFTADSAHRLRLKAGMGDGPFDGVDHECFYQMKNARTSLKEHWPQVHIYEIESNRVLLFTMQDGTRFPINLLNYPDLCGLLIFDPRKKPVLADMMGIGTSLENYFLK